MAAAGSRAETTMRRRWLTRKTKRSWLSKGRSLVVERVRIGEEQLAIGRAARSPVAQIADKMMQPSK